MKEYLKMADVFGDASQEYIEQLLYSGFLSKDSCDLMAHAVSSHDELVAEVEMLRGALNDMHEWLVDLKASLDNRTQQAQWIESAEE